MDRPGRISAEMLCSAVCRGALLTLCLAVTGAAQAEGFNQVVASRFGSADVLRLVTESSLPEPGADEVRLRVLTASASFTDVMVRKGLYPGAPGETPLVPGYDLVGIVDKLGADVTGFAPGQRVAALTVWGAYTEVAIQPAARLVPVPDELPDEAAVALILSYTTAYQMLHRVAKVQPGDSALIHGASGAVGTALAQLGRLEGLNLIGTASGSKADYVRSLGVQPIDYRTEDFVSRVRELTGGAGVDVVFDAISVDNFARSYEALKPDGRLVTYGLYHASLTGAPGSSRALLGEFLRWQWRRLMWDWFPDQQKTVAFYSISEMREERPDWFRDDLSQLFQLAVQGQIKPIVWKTLPLAEAAEAHRMIENHEVRGKIVLRVADRE